MITRIGIVDKHPLFRLGLRHVLSGMPNVVFVGEVESRAEALHLVRDAEVDVLLVGMNLPASESVALAKNLHESGASVRVLVLSAYEDDPSPLYEMLGWRVAGYVLKTERPEVLLEAIRVVARGEGGWLSQQLERRFMEPGIQPIAVVLSRRDKEVLALLARGYSNQHIADELFISVQTVKNQVTLIYDKLGVKARVGAVAWAWEHGIGGREG